MSHMRGFSRGRQVADGIVGHARGVEEILDRIDRVSATNATVLITGETGTGKELVARAIHRRSRRSSHAMVSANLAALPHELVASELFGHEAGAFTGAVRRRIGRFEAAHASSLFLDEVGELPLGVQVALLRALQEGEFERVGSSQTTTADVRVIAATNRHLEEAIEEGLFRRDLFYRLAVFPIHLPPLRERREDIAHLADHFLAQVTDRIGRAFSGIDPDSIDRLTAYSWPGNIRELQNVIEHSAILSDGGLLQVPPMLLSTRMMAGPTTASTLSHAIEAGAGNSADMPEVILTDRECRARERANLNEGAPAYRWSHLWRWRCRRAAWSQPDDPCVASARPEDHTAEASLIAPRLPP